MTWAKLDDGIYKHEKLLAVSVPARWLFIAAIAYSRDESLGGRFTKAQLAFLVGSQGVKPSAIRELVEVKLLEERGKHVVIHDYDDYNPPSSRERTRRWRQGRDSESDVTVTPGEPSLPRHGDEAADVTPRTRAGGNPVPRSPLPVVGDEVTSTSEPTNPPATPPIQRAEGVNTQNGELPQVLRWMQFWSDKCGGRALTEPERDFLRRVPYECDRLSEQQVTETLAAIAEKHLEAGKRVPLATYAAGKLSDLQAQAADEGVRPRGPHVLGPVHIGKVLG